MEMDREESIEPASPGQPRPTAMDEDRAAVAILSPRAAPAKEARSGALSPAGRPLSIASVQLKIVDENLAILQEFGPALMLDVKAAATGRCRVSFLDGSNEVFGVMLQDGSHVYQAGSTLVFLRVSQGSAVVTLKTQNDTNQLMSLFHMMLSRDQKKPKKQSVFNLRTEESSARQYFQFYGYLSQQQNMLQDYIRTSTFQSAMLQNTKDFTGKVVVDIGAGSGILSFFALQAGARKVYAIEASSMAAHCHQLICDNRLADKMVIIAGKVEEVELPEMADVLISEPMGYMLFNERMLESYLFAKRWLKPGGKMFPTQGILYCAPFTDDALYMEQLSKANFWYQQCFHGVDLSSLRQSAMEEYLRQPILDTFDVRILMASPLGHTTDFLKSSETDLHKITIPLSFKLWSTGTIHGLAFWFDVAFIGTETTVWLSTAPFHPLTHWYQIRCLLRNPIYVRSGQELTGTVLMVANERQSYDISIDIAITGCSVHSSNTYDLKNPNFRYMASAPPPPGSHHDNPTETYFESQQHTNPYSPPAPNQTSGAGRQGGVYPGASVFTPQGVVGVPAANTEVIPVVNGGIVSPSQHVSPTITPSHPHTGTSFPLHYPHTSHPHATHPPPYAHPNLQVYSSPGGGLSGGLLPIPSPFAIPSPVSSGTLVFQKVHQGGSLPTIYHPTSPPIHPAGNAPQGAKQL